MKRLLAVLCLFICMTGQALATDLVATYKYEDGSTMKLAARDSKHVRMDTGPDSYLLLVGDKMYAVSRSDGQWQAMDMDKMSGMMGMFASSGSSEIKDLEVKYAKTGRKEKIAGYTGKVYDVDVYEGSKLVSRDEVVMSTHNDLKRINDAWTAVALRMGNMMDKETAQSLQRTCEEARKAGYGGVLRYGSEMTLASMKRTDLGSSYFELPSGTTQVEGPSQAQGDDTLKQDAKDVGQAAKDEAKQATIDEVREGVRDVFNGLFN
ncbi:hypothetical protein [Salidesulfovibrio onnuriiensis]|uniref:hypothetical protein n=1 Tax=Salidesulfovibrio onnuriiensis TaxID=2583823 RepID=UPI0011C7C131|nr:hypothetical protein [Salidesulfovibrio onnuriiensis]